MKLYLTSNGLENSIVSNHFEMMFLPKEPKDLSFLVISVQDNESDGFYLEETKNKLNQTGVINIDVFELGAEKFHADKEYDVIYVCGGNTFVYLDRIRKTGLDQFIIDSVTSGRSTYVGVSAGSIIAGPSIEIAGWGSQSDSNDIGLKDLRGLNLTGTTIYPHYTKELASELNKFKERYGHQIETLEDDQAIMLNYTDMGRLKDVSSFLYVNKDL